ncbi:MAG: hypothetical protein H8D67_17470 [Deltaproteobacteria bacterium]|nr:hypothetical protein [Deltaproteobacteria bacterium]
MNPKFLREMADLLEDPERLQQDTDRVKARLFQLAEAFDNDHNKPRTDSDDFLALLFGLTITDNTAPGFERIQGLSIVVRMAHWLGYNEGHKLGHKQAKVEQLFQTKEDKNGKTKLRQK